MDGLDAPDLNLDFPAFLGEFRLKSANKSRVEFHPPPRFADAGVVTSLQTEASLIVATMDLSVVQLLRQAIRTADLSSAINQQSAAPASSLRVEPRRRIHPEPVIEPRTHVHPSPTYEPRPVIRRHARVGLEGRVCGTEVPQACPMKLGNPIQPPWRILPWENPVQTRQTVKIHLIHTDVINKGTLLDLFV